MRKFIVLFLLATCYCQFIACNTSSPEKYFDTAVLSCNTIHGFAGGALHRQLESPSVKMINGDKDNFAPMKRKEVMEDIIQSATSNLDKLKKLKRTADTGEMLQASIALYDYVLPVYNKEYMELARLYDEGASGESIAAYTQMIQDTYFPGYAGLFDKLTASGKAYAEKHNINVKWDVRTSPR